MNQYMQLANNSERWRILNNSIEEQIYISLRKWVNHTKEGARRSKEDLIKFDDMWNFIRHLIEKVESINNRNEEEEDILRMIKYTGKLYRFHKKYDETKPNYGIQETNHFVSWSKSNKVNDFYWLSENQSYILITSIVDEKDYGIDLVGLCDYFQKYYSDTFKLGTPAILQEQEVVYPITYSRICNIEVNKNLKIKKGNK